jgi:hypothetical protein
MDSVQECLKTLSYEINSSGHVLTLGVICKKTTMTNEMVFQPRSIVMTYAREYAHAHTHKLCCMVRIQFMWLS